MSACRRGGFTLVELCIVAVIFVLLSAGLLTTFLAGRTSYMSADAFIQVQQESRRAFDAMVRELREAGSVDVDTPGPLLGERLNFQIARGYNLDPVACLNAICWGDETANGRWVHYAVVAAGDVSQLVRFTSAAVGDNLAGACTPANNCRVLANYYLDDVNTPLFTYNTVDQSVTVTLQIRYNSSTLPTGGMSSPPLTSRVTLRN